jgi:hypothetical protein
MPSRRCFYLTGLRLAGETGSKAGSVSVSTRSPCPAPSSAASCASALPASDHAHRHRGPTPGPTSPVHSGIRLEGFAATSTNCLLPRGQFASRISTPRGQPRNIAREWVTHRNRFVASRLAQSVFPKSCRHHRYNTFVNMCFGYYSTSIF